ncbi:glycoside hydrolase family 3 protein [bacterium]|nr:glycoside hydrolase family 3 protein [bacterium]
MLNKCILSWESGEKELLFSTLASEFIGGIIIFQKHIGPDISELLRDIKEISKNPGLVICVDQEGGTVRRFTDDDISVMGAREASTRQDTAQYGKSIQAMAHKLAGYGINMILAPVVDIVLSEKNILYDRSYGSLNKIEIYAATFIKALNTHNIMPCIKHFFGYGLSEPDPHHHVHHLPEGLDLNTALAPFRKFAATGYKGAVMTAHTRYLNDEIITYSRKWVYEALRDELGFTGHLITDDLMMKSAGEEPLKDKVNAAVDAGHDLCIVSGSLESALNRIL